MIIGDIHANYDCSVPTKRIREEINGGQYFDPISGRISSLNEKELSEWLTRAEGNPQIAYYASRQWSKEPLTKGCCSAPNRIYLEITKKCNLSCTMCYRDAGVESANEMNTESAKSLINKLATIGVHELRFTGGEPTMRTDILELIDYAVLSGLFISLGTNGIWPEGIVDAILERPIGRFLVSLDGPGLINDAFRGKNAFERTVETIKKILAKGRNVRINTMLTRSTFKHLDAFAKICSGYGIQYMAMIVPRPTGRAIDGNFRHEFPTHQDMKETALAIEPIYKKYGLKVEFQYNIYGDRPLGQDSDPVVQKIVSCPAGGEAAFISPEGEFYPCGCVPDWSGKPAIKNIFVAGNVLNMSAYDIWHTWQTSKIWEVFRDLRRSKSRECFECQHYGAGCFGSCPVHSYIINGTFNGHDPMCWVERK